MEVCVFTTLPSLSIDLGRKELRTKRISMSGKITRKNLKLSDR